MRKAGYHLSDCGEALGLESSVLGVFEESDIVADQKNRRGIFVVGKAASVPDQPAAHAVAADNGAFKRRGAPPFDDSCQLAGHGLSVGLGQEEIQEVASAEFADRVTCKPFRKRAEIDDRAIGADDDDQALSSLDQMPEDRLAAFLGPRKLAGARRFEPGWPARGRRSAA